MDIDALAYDAVFSSDEIKKQKRAEIRQIAQERGILPSSIHNFYKTIGKETVSGFTVPAINIRALTYHTASVIFSLMNKHSIGPVIFEIARSEIDYTDQQPDEYAVCILAAALKENYKGPVFIQADHVQFSKRKFEASKDEEVGKIKKLVTEAIAAGFYNVDIDASTLVDLSKEKLSEQQQNNYEVTAELTSYIRNLQPHGVTISIGGEIGHIGGKNSTPEDFKAFMNGYLPLITTEGISKVSVQTGTSHGGMVLPDGTMQEVQLDFDVLKTIGDVARKEYGLGGAVQHGASTLPSDLFDKFVNAQTLEIHLATGFQNIVYDNLPSSLKEEMYDWVRQNSTSERDDGWTDEQFIYKLRKKAIGPFKKALWDLSGSDKEPILKGLSDQFSVLFEKLSVFNTKDILLSHV